MYSAYNAAMAEVTQASTRVRCIDWLRGLAVVNMIQWHAACLLRPGSDKSTLGWLSGLVAPSFIFAAGFAVALTMVRASGDPAARKRRAVRSLQRIAEVLVVALVLKWVTRGAQDWWKLDILTTIALSLLASWPVMVAFASRPRVVAGVSLTMAVALFVVSPHVPDAKWGIAAGSSDFAPTPWAAYVFLGAFCGALASMGIRAFGGSLVAVVGLGAVFRFATSPWLLTNMGERLMLTGGLALALLWIERDAVRHRAALNWPPFSWLETVGTNALTAYVVHIWLLYVNTPVVKFSCWGWWGEKLSWAQYGAVVVGLWFVAWGASVVWPKATAAVSARLPWGKPKPRAA